MTLIFNESDLAAGVRGFKEGYDIIAVNHVDLTAAMPNLNQWAMFPGKEDVTLRDDPTKVGEGQAFFNWASNDIRMQRWKIDTERPVQTVDAKGVMTLKTLSVAAATRLRADEVVPFGNAFISTLEAKELTPTLERVRGQIEAAAIRDRADLILGIIDKPEDGMFCWDGLPLIDENHLHMTVVHRDNPEFSNRLQGGITPAHTVGWADAPLRVDVDNPTIQEMYNEILYILRYRTAIGRDPTQKYQKVHQFNKIEILTRNEVTTNALIELNRIKFAHLIDAVQAEGEMNPLFGAIELTRTYGDVGQFSAAEENHYHAIVHVEGVRAAVDIMPGNPRGSKIYIPPVPRPLMFIPIREHNGLDMKYDAWEHQSTFKVGIWEHYAIGYAFPQEIVRFEPANP